MRRGPALVKSGATFLFNNVPYKNVLMVAFMLNVALVFSGCPSYTGDSEK